MKILILREKRRQRKGYFYVGCSASVKRIAFRHGLWADILWPYLLKFLFIILIINREFWILGLKSHPRLTVCKLAWESFAVNFNYKSCKVYFNHPSFPLCKGILNWHQFLEGPDGVENARFGSAIAALSDINMDGFNDVIVGSPLENQNSGAVYIYNGHEGTIRLKYSQVIHEFHGDVFTSEYQCVSNREYHADQPIHPSYIITLFIHSTNVSCASVV